MGAHWNVHLNTKDNEIGNLIWDDDLSSKYSNSYEMIETIGKIAKEEHLLGNEYNRLGCKDYLFTKSILLKRKKDIIFLWEKGKTKDLWVDRMLTYMEDNKIQTIWLGIDY